MMQEDLVAKARVLADAAAMATPGALRVAVQGFESAGGPSFGVQVQFLFDELDPDGWHAAWDATECLGELVEKNPFLTAGEEFENDGVVGVELWPASW